MEYQKKTMNIQTQFYALLGPFLITCALLIMAIRPTPIPWGLAFAALIGTIICYQWLWRGAMISFLLLTGTFLYHLHSVQYSDWAWLLVLASAIGSAFIVSALALEEFHESFGSIQENFERQRQQSATAKESQQIQQMTWAASHSALEAKIEKLQLELRERDERIATSERMLTLSQDDLNESSKNHEKILQELLHARQEAIAFELQLSQEPKLEELQIENQKLSEERISQHTLIEKLSLGESELQIRVKELSDLVQILSVEKKQVESVYARVQIDMENLQRIHQKQIDGSVAERKSLDKDHHDVVESISIENQRLKDSLAQMKMDIESTKIDYEQILEQRTLEIGTASADQLRLKANLEEVLLEKQLSKDKLNKLEKAFESIQGEYQSLAIKRAAEQQITDQQQLELNVLRESIEELQSKAAVEPSIDLANNKQAIDREIRRVTGLYEQLRVQFAEKTTLLDQTRRELFHMQEKEESLNKSFEEAKFNMEREHERHIAELLSNAENELALIEQQESEIKQLNDLITALVK